MYLFPFLGAIDVVHFTFAYARNTQYSAIFAFESHLLVQLFLKREKLILFYFHCIPFSGLFISLGRSKF